MNVYELVEQLNMIISSNDAGDYNVVDQNGVELKRFTLDFAENTLTLTGDEA